MPKSGVPAFSYVRVGKRFIENMYAYVSRAADSYLRYCSLSLDLAILLCNYVCPTDRYWRFEKSFRLFQKRWMSTPALPIATYILGKVSYAFRKQASVLSASMSLEKLCLRFWKPNFHWLEIILILVATLILLSIAIESNSASSHRHLRPWKSIDIFGTTFCC